MARYQKVFPGPSVDGYQYLIATAVLNGARTAGKRSFHRMWLETFVESLRQTHQRDEAVARSSVDPSDWRSLGNHKRRWERRQKALADTELIWRKIAWICNAVRVDSPVIFIPDNFKEMRYRKVRGGFVEKLSEVGLLMAQGRAHFD